jgi:hypothetical protein
MSKELVAAKSSTSLQYFNPEAWDYMEKMAQKFIESKALPSTITNAAQLMLTFQAGYELGMKPVESLRNLYIVKGRVAMQGNAMLKKMLEAGVRIVWNEVSGTKVKATFKRDGQEPFVSELTMTEAQSRKLDMAYDYQSKSWTKKPAWVSFPDNMLMWKVVSKAGKFYCADIIEGVELYEDVIDALNVEPGEAKIIDPEEPAQAPAEGEDQFEDLKGRISRSRTESGLEKLKKEMGEGSYTPQQQRELVDAWAARRSEIVNDDAPAPAEGQTAIPDAEELTEDEKKEAAKYAAEAEEPAPEAKKEGGKLKDLFGKK